MEFSFKDRKLCHRKQKWTTGMFKNNPKWKLLGRQKHKHAYLLNFKSCYRMRNLISFYHSSILCSNMLAFCTMFYSSTGKKMSCFYHCTGIKKLWFCSRLSEIRENIKHCQPEPVMDRDKCHQTGSTTLVSRRKEMENYATTR